MICKIQRFICKCSKKYDFDNLTQGDIEELISAKLEKEANRYIQQWEKKKFLLKTEDGKIFH